MKYTWKCTGIQAIDDMGRQLEKIVRTMNQNSIETRYRYVAAMERYIKFVVPAFKQSKLCNMQDKHITAYARHMMDQGKKDRYIKTDLSGLRFFHNQMTAMGLTRRTLTDPVKHNKEIGLGKTPPGRVDRSWSHKEVVGAADIAIEKGKPHFATAIYAMWLTGMRLNECLSLRRDAIESSLRTGKLPLQNTKGGRYREIPISPQTQKFFAATLENVERGAYVFVPSGQKVHQVKQELKEFLYETRGEFQDLSRSRSAHSYSDRQRPGASAHGLRHSFAQSFYRECRDNGMSDREARIELAQALGHNRTEVTYIYVPQV